MQAWETTLQQYECFGVVFFFLFWLLLFYFSASRKIKGHWMYLSLGACWYRATAVSWCTGGRPVPTVYVERFHKKSENADLQAEASGDQWWRERFLWVHWIIHKVKHTIKEKPRPIKSCRDWNRSRLVSTASQKTWNATQLKVLLNCNRKLLSQFGTNKV